MKKYALIALLLCLALCLPALAAADDDKPMLDVVWVMDCTGSMDILKYVEKINNNLDFFAAKLTDFDVRYGMVAFGDEVNSTIQEGCVYPEETKKIQWDGSDWTRDLSVLKSSMAFGDEGSLPRYYGGSTPQETSTFGIYMAVTQYKWRENAVRAIVLVTDYYDYIRKGTSVITNTIVPGMPTCEEWCKKKNISLNLARFYNVTDNDYYANTVKIAGGISKYVGGTNSSNQKTSMEQLAQWIHDTPIVLTQPEDRYVHVGDNVSFMASTVAKEKVLTTWYAKNSNKPLQQNNDASTTYTISNVTKAMNGKVYYCRFTNQCTGSGQTDNRYINTNDVTLYVASKFAITGQPSPQRVEAGQTATFTVAATGDSLTYQWQKLEGENWVDLSGATSATLSITATLADNGSVYRCVVKDAISDKPGGYPLPSNPARLTVDGAPAITSQPQNVTTEAGMKATFTVTATGTGLTYQWQQQVDGGWIDMPGETGTSLNVTATTANSGSVYRCQVTSSYGTVVASQSAVLTVDGAPAITSQPQNVTTEAGMKATFTVTATGTGLTYQWQQQVNGSWADLPGQTGTSLTVLAATENSGSVYRCQVTSSYGTVVASQSAALTVDGAPVITGQMLGITIEAGKEVTFPVTAKGTGLTYQWQQLVNGSWADLPGETGTFLTFTATMENSGSVYRCQVTSSYGTVVVSDPATLTVVAAPAITSQPQNVTTEAGMEATFTVAATGTGLTYQWQQKNGDDWDNLPGETGTSLTVTATTENSGSVYRCQVTSGYGTVVASDPAALTVDGTPAITGQPQNVTTEAGKTAVFTVQAAGAGLKYQWQQQVNGGWIDMPGETGTSLTVTATTENSGSVYRCQVTSSYSTVVVSDPAALTVDGTPAITGQPQNVTTEAGKTAVFTVQAAGAGLKYQWQQQVNGGWADLPGETGTSLTVTATTENSGSVYRCQVTSSYGTVVVSDPAALTVQGAPAITGQPESIAVTEGEDASITVAATGEGLKYQWQVYRNGVWMNCTDGQSPTLTLRSPALSADGQAYRCVITSSYGTTVTSDTVKLTVLAKVEPPQTGDASRPWLWLTLLGTSLLGLAMLRRRRA